MAQTRTFPCSKHDCSVWKIEKGILNNGIQKYHLFCTECNCRGNSLSPNDPLHPDMMNSNNSVKEPKSKIVVEFMEKIDELKTYLAENHDDTTDYVASAGWEQRGASYHKYMQFGEAKITLSVCPVSGNKHLISGEIDKKKFEKAYKEFDNIEAALKYTDNQLIKFIYEKQNDANTKRANRGTYEGNFRKN